ncbi:MAG: carboxylesterase family protein [Myxococcales bacterium]|nr:carboxylesterase family protein [Myxococcales bacterium]
MRPRLLLLALASPLACTGDADDTTTTTASTGATEAAATDELPTGSGAPATTDVSATDPPEPTTGEPTGTTGDDACGDTPTAGAVVRTTHGPIEGASAGDVLAFRGVRYAAAPTGELRLRPPVEPACSPDITPAVDYGPVCPQLVKNQAGVVTDVLGDEDCLSLNVWTPATGPGARPVLVFVHGGGNSVGTGSDELYIGAGLAAARDVVVVTFNYRLGALGWLTHPDLAAESEAGVSGNYALLDQIAALRWVQANIAEFGGDPDHVLLFGESAGAVNTCALLHAPAAAGLYHAAVVQSGACRERPLADYAAGMSNPLVTSAGCDGTDDVPACLRSIPAAELVALAPDGYPDVAALSQGWGPHVDGVVLPSDGLSAMSEGTHNEVPIIIGNNAAETAAAVPPLTDVQFQALVTATFGPLADAVLAQYPLADYPDARAAYVALTSDVKFVCNARRSARAADAGQDLAVYRYVFAYDGYTVLQGEPAASHGLELIYLFGNFDAVLPGAIEYEPNPDDLAMRDAIQGWWTAFAASGDPSTAELAWPPYGPADPYAGLDVPTSSGTGVRGEQCDFWDSLLGG